MPFHFSVPPLQFVLLLGAALGAGAINSAAGGGTLLTFPVLLSILSGVPNGSVIANGTSTVALLPGSMSAFWGYRRELVGQKRSLWEMAAPSLLGGLGGAYLANVVNPATFSRLVPWLIFGATFLFLIQDPVRRWIGRGGAAEGAAEPKPLGIGGMVFQFFVAVYGGFFGAGIGILMLAALGFLGQTNIHRMNGLKNFAAICINGIGAMTFIVYKHVDWPLALSMMIVAILGGYGGAGLAQRVGQANVRRFVIAIGLLFGAWTLYGQLHHG